MEQQFDNSTEIGTSPERREQLADRPRIYVASLSDYNAGRLHGRWIDATQDVDIIDGEIQAMLAASPEPVAEEYAIHDHEHFGGLAIGEYQSIDTVARLARGMVTHGPAFVAWAEHLGTSEWGSDLDRFEDAFLGEWESAVDYAGSLLDDMGIDTEAFGPEWLSPYIHVDLDAFARDLSYDINVIEHDDRVYVFEP
jgi:antirestriction protein